MDVGVFGFTTGKHKFNLLGNCWVVMCTKLKLIDVLLITMLATAYQFFHWKILGNNNISALGIFLSGLIVVVYREWNSRYKSNQQLDEAYVDAGLKLMKFKAEFPIALREYESKMISESRADPNLIYRINVQHESKDDIEVAADFASLICPPAFSNCKVLLEAFEVFGNPRKKLRDIAEQYSKSFIECDQASDRYSEFSNAYVFDHFNFYTVLRSPDEFASIAGQLYVNDWVLSFWTLEDSMKLFTVTSYPRFETEIFANLSKPLYVAVVNIFDHEHMEIYTSDLKIAQAFNEKLLALND